MLGMLAMPVLGNDAGTGGDAGNTTSTATPLPAVNGTYYGNLTSSSDTSDYYLINMSSNTGIAVEITYPSSVDFDLALLDSGGGYIDLSTSSGTTDDVTSNSTSVGGNSVYIVQYLNNDLPRYIRYFFQLKYYLHQIVLQLVEIAYISG